MKIISLLKYQRSAVILKQNKQKRKPHQGNYLKRVIIKLFKITIPQLFLNSD
jgi:hypothetical protein